MRGDSGRREADESRAARLTAGRVAALVTLAVGVLAFVALRLSDPTDTGTAGYQLVITAVALVPSVLVLLLRPGASTERCCSRRWCSSARRP